MFQSTFYILVFFSYAFWPFSACSDSLKNDSPCPLSVVSVMWGEQTVDHPLIQALLEAPLMQRLQHIDQSGPVRYFGYAPAYSRYEHSVGVWALLKRFNCPFPEQVAGLLHDASHTVFSHVADHLFAQPQSEYSYQDTIHLWFLDKMQVVPLISPYNLTLKQMDAENVSYRGLEQHLPDMCADRIEYNLHTGLLFKRITKEELIKILDDLRFENGQWFFVSISSARKFADLSLYFTEYHWGAAWNLVFYHYFKEILQRAMELNLITRDHIHFSTDQKVVNILLNAEVPYIQKRLQACRCIHQSFTLVEGEDYDLYFQPKFRGIDPLVSYNNALYRLTTLDPSFNKAYHQLKEKCKKGYKISLTILD